MKIEIEYNNGDVVKTREWVEWLDERMPNAPLPEPQRWTIIDNWEIEFQNEHDAIVFKLRWE
jgi:hypothetical protein